MSVHGTREGVSPSISQRKAGALGPWGVVIAEIDCEQEEVMMCCNLGQLLKPAGSLWQSRKGEIGQKWPVRSQSKYLR